MPTRAQLESALRNADAAGDAEGAKQLANALKGNQFSDAQPQQAKQDSGFWQKAWEAQQPIERGAKLAIRSVAEGLALLPLAAADIAAYPVNLASRALTGSDALGSYQQLFQTGLNELGFPNYQGAGEELAGAIGRGASSAAGGIGVGQLLQQAPGAVARGVGDVLVSAPGAQAVAGGSAGASAELARQAGAGPEAQQVAGLVGGLAGGLSASRLDAPAPQASLPAGAATTAPQAAAIRTADAQAEAMAQQGAQRVGLDWSVMDDGLKTQMLKNAQQAVNINSDLPPEAIARKALYESLGIKPTRALITRSFKDALNEQNLLTEEEGQALRNIYITNNQAIRSQIESLAPDGVKAVDLPSYGEALRADIAKGAKQSNKTTSKFYEVARTQEGDNPANIDDLFTFMQSNRSRLATSNASSPVISYLKDAGLWTKESAKSYSKGEPVQLARSPTLNELTDLRKVINNAASSSIDKNAQSLLGSMRGILDDAEAAAGGEAFKQARRVFGQQKSIWEGNPLLVNLLKDKRGFRGVDTIPDEEVFKTAIINSTNDDFSAVWSRANGAQKNLTRAQLAQYISDKTFSNMGMNEAGDVVASAAKVNSVLQQINPQKLKIIFGPEKAAKLERLNQVVKEISNPPKGTVPQGSAPKLTYLYRNALSILNIAGKIPGLNVVVDVAEKRAAASANRAASEAAINPLPINPQTGQPLLQRIQPLSPLLAPSATGGNR